VSEDRCRGASTLGIRYPWRRAPRRMSLICGLNPGLRHLSEDER